MVNTTFEQLESLLHKMGFKRLVIGDTHYLYGHEKKNAQLVLRRYSPHDRVSAADLVGIRKTVTENGIADAEVFEPLIRNFSHVNADHAKAGTT